jgi:hypothetical protein
VDVEDEIDKIVKNGVDVIFEECIDILGNCEWLGGADETFMDMIKKSIERELDNS